MISIPTNTLHSICGTVRKANTTTTAALPEYNRWLDDFDTDKYAAFDMWHGAESEYDDYRTVAQQNESDRRLQNDEDFFCIGKHIERDDLGKQDVVKWIAETVEDLLPLYEACHGA
ncbi:TPA: HI_0552 family protein [Neisseria meningitidis]